jgi:hypothetical protein
MFDVCSITNSPIEPLLIDPPEAEGQAFSRFIVEEKINTVVDLAKAHPVVPG